MFGRKKKIEKPIVEYFPDKQVPIIKASICNGEQVVGFREVMLVKKTEDLVIFKEMYGFDENMIIGKEY